MEVPYRILNFSELMLDNTGLISEVLWSFQISEILALGSSAVIVVPALGSSVIIEVPALGSSAVIEVLALGSSAVIEVPALGSSAVIEVPALGSSTVTGILLHHCGTLLMRGSQCCEAET
jgi:hypothetical protein